MMIIKLKIVWKVFVTTQLTVLLMLAMCLSQTLQITIEID